MLFSTIWIFLLMRYFSPPYKKEGFMNLRYILLPALVMLSLPGCAAANPEAEASIVIDAPLETIWSLVIDVDRWPSWNPAIEDAQIKGSFLPGSEFAWTSGGTHIRSKVQAVEPHKSLYWTGEAFGTNAIHSWDFAMTSQGVLVKTHESFSGWLPALLPKMMQRKLDETLAALLNSLKTAAEAHSRSLQPRED